MGQRMKGIAFEVTLLVILATASIALAAVEAAFYLLKRRRLSHVAMPNPRAELANRYLDDPPTLLMPIHIGTFTAHAGMTVIITVLFLDLLAHWAMLVAFLAMLIYLLLFRLTLPYALVRRNPERSLLVLLPFFHLYAQALGPLVTALRKRAVLEPGAPDAADETPRPVAPRCRRRPSTTPTTTRLEDALARFCRDPGARRDDAAPRHRGDRGLGNRRRAAPLMRETKYSRIPVFGENLDDIVGVVEVRDLIDFDGRPERDAAGP